MRSSPGTDRSTSPAVDQGELSPEELRARLDQTLADLAAAEDRYLRARADLDNYRKRAERELDRRVRDQGDELLRAWLEVVDSVERALVLEPDPRLTQGLRAFLDQMDAILTRQGVERIGEIGQEFNPELHEAVAVIPDADRPPGTLAEIARSGYSVGDRVLRPAQVAVTRRRDDTR